MVISRQRYKWFYDHIWSHVYDLVIKYSFLPFGGERRCRRRLLSSIDFTGKRKILDMGCGTGGSTAAIAEQAPASQVIGIDISDGQIRVAKRKRKSERLTFRQADAAATDFEAESFDMVVIAHAVHEMLHEQRLMVLQEAKRLLADESSLIIIELDNPPSLLLRLFVGFWNFYWLPFNFETPTRRDMLRHGLESELAETGFVEISKSSFYKGVFQVVQGRK
jgi:demethylmenaquinone methyltransferase/2-methoxy-6-polyprenyl-1,4-benzoquinol methylase